MINSHISRFFDQMEKGKGKGKGKEERRRKKHGKEGGGRAEGEGRNSTSRARLSKIKSYRQRKRGGKEMSEEVDGIQFHMKLVKRTDLLAFPLSPPKKILPSHPQTIFYIFF